MSRNQSHRRNACPDAQNGQCKYAAYGVGGRNRQAPGIVFQSPRNVRTFRPQASICVKNTCKRSCQAVTGTIGMHAETLHRFGARTTDARLAHMHKSKAQMGQSNSIVPAASIATPGRARGRQVSTPIVLGAVEGFPVPLFSRYEAILPPHSVGPQIARRGLWYRLARHPLWPLTLAIRFVRSLWTGWRANTDPAPFLACPRSLAPHTLPVECRFSSSAYF